MKETTLAVLGKENEFDAIGKEWLLVCAGTPEKCNMMTASWGGLGILWGKPVAYIFIRPERYTHDFIEAQAHLTLSLLGPEGKAVHKVCGTQSGRDIDKIAATGLRPVALAPDAVGFEQARLTLLCRKLFKTSFTDEDFIDRDVLARWYGPKEGGLHDLYICEIERVFEQ